MQFRKVHTDVLRRKDPKIDMQISAFFDSDALGHLRSELSMITVGTFAAFASISPIKENVCGPRDSGEDLQPKSSSEFKGECD